MREALKYGWAAAFLLLGGLLGAGLIYLASRPPQGEPIRLLPPPTPAPLVVHVTGRVARPGVYRLPPDSRVADALQAAGGSLADGNPQALNLAAPLADGSRVYVPPLQNGTSLPEKTGEADRMPAVADIDGRVNINTATQAELESLPGIGPTLASRIIAYRQEHGAFTRLEDLQKVSGIGEGLFNKIKDLITIEGEP